MRSGRAPSRALLARLRWTTPALLAAMVACSNGGGAVETPTSGSPASGAVPASASPGAAAFSVWVGDDVVDQVDQIDPATDRVVQTIQIGRFIGDDDPDIVVTGDGSVWAGIVAHDTTNDRVERLDPANGSVIATIKLPTLFPLAMTVTSDAVWVSGTTNEIEEIDPATNHLVGSITLGSPRGGFEAVGAGLGSLWAVGDGGSQTEATLFRIDPTTRKVLASFPVGGQDNGGIAFEDGSVWVSNGHDGTVSAVDPATGKVRTVKLGKQAEPGGIAFADGKVWVTGVTHLFEIDPASGQVTKSKFFVNTLYGAIAASDGALWVPEDHQLLVDTGDVLRIDPATGRVVGRVRVPHGTAPVAVAIG